MASDHLEAAHEALERLGEFYSKEEALLAAIVHALLALVECSQPATSERAGIRCGPDED